MKIYVKFGKQRSIREFLTKFFSDETTHYQYLTGIETYYDKECTKIQCRTGKYRSFEDVLDLVNTYYSNVSPKNLMKIICSLELKNSQGSNKNLYTLFCNNIQKPVLLFTQWDPKFSTNSGKGYSKYSWKELFEMIK